MPLWKNYNIQNIIGTKNVWNIMAWKKIRQPQNYDKSLPPNQLVYNIVSTNYQIDIICFYNNYKINFITRKYFKYYFYGTILYW